MYQTAEYGSFQRDVGYRKLKVQVCKTVTKCGIMSQSKHKINKIYVENNEIPIFGATLKSQICEKEDTRCAKSFILKNLRYAVDILCSLAFVLCCHWLYFISLLQQSPNYWKIQQEKSNFDTLIKSKENAVMRNRRRKCAGFSVLTVKLNILSMSKLAIF